MLSSGLPGTTTGPDSLPLIADVFRGEIEILQLHGTAVAASAVGFEDRENVGVEWNRLRLISPLVVCRPVKPMTRNNEPT